ncbi:MAG: antitoxin VapB family protein [Candidatus Micrarchaeota archaeon]|nr:antitoxin VapB family protein [Candidatus Micrarchaeota archaeon]MDE1864986.1 antitoxin VapB family protein [Candidatus Micrarchaeota archaeon]
MVRIISISDEVYDELKEIKEGRSFTKVIGALLASSKNRKGKGTRSLEKFFGTIDNKTARAWMKEIDESRGNFGKSRF